MSQTQTALMFEDAPVAVLKPMYCVGRLSEVKELVATTTGTYLRLPFTVAPLYTGQTGRGGLLLRQEWLVPGFKPGDVYDLETKEGTSAASVYGRNLKGSKGRKGAPDTISVLAGLCATPERFNTLANALLSIDVPQTDKGYIDVVEKTIVDFIFPNGASAIDPETGEGYVLGYKLKQNSEKNEETGAYELRNGYQLDSFFFATDAEVERLQRTAETGTIKIGW